MNCRILSCSFALYGLEFSKQKATLTSSQTQPDDANSLGNGLDLD